MNIEFLSQILRRRRHHRGTGSALSIGVGYMIIGLRVILSAKTFPKLAARVMRIISGVLIFAFGIFLIVLFIIRIFSG